MKIWSLSAAHRSSDSVLPTVRHSLKGFEGDFAVSCRFLPSHHFCEEPVNHTHDVCPSSALGMPDHARLRIRISCSDLTEAALVNALTGTPSQNLCQALRPTSSHSPIASQIYPTTSSRQGRRQRSLACLPHTGRSQATSVSNVIIPARI